MTTEQDRQLVPMKADDPPPLEVARFEFSVSPPSLCNVGSLPYPLVVKGPEPAFGLPIGQKTCMTELIIWQWFDSGEYRKVKSISKQQPGLGPFGSQAMILEDIRLEKPGKYMFEYFVSLWDGQEGKITRRARVASHEFSVQEGYDNTTIRRSDQENQEVQKLIERNVEYEHAFNHYIKLHPQSCRDCLTKFAGL